LNSIALFLGVLPLLIFVVVDTFSSLKAALITAVVFALLEAFLSLYWFGTVDWITGFSVLLIIALAAVSFYRNTAIHFKLQPAILSAIFGLLFLVSFWIGKPILYLVAEKYQTKFPQEMQEMMSHYVFKELLKLSSHYMGYAFLLHAGVTLWAALKLSKWWWIAMRGIGFYVFMFAAMIIARFQIGL